jgi:hypothetical protein
VPDESTPLAGVADDEAITPPTTLAATDAYEEAGVGPGDLDFVEFQDTDAGRELLSWYELGLCGPGDQRKLLQADDPQRHRVRQRREPQPPLPLARIARWSASRPTLIAQR